MSMLSPPDPRPPLEGISSEEYKKEICSITDDECCHYNCRTCETAREMHEQLAKEYKEAENAEFTTFERLTHLEGFAVMVNPANTICTFGLTTLQEFFKIARMNPKTTISTTPRPYSPIYMEQYAGLLRKLRKYNNLGIPDEIWADKYKPAIFGWGFDKYYMIAPRFEDED